MAAIALICGCGSSAVEPGVVTREDSNGVSCIAGAGNACYRKWWWG